MVFMALIKLGGLAQDVRGSLNGTTFSRNRGGAYVRTKTSPVQPVSEFSSRARAIFGDISQRWAVTLTQSQRGAWIAFASTHTFVNVFGDSITLSGIAMYQAINRMLGQIGKPYLDDPPVEFSVPSVVSATIAGTVDTGVLGTLTNTTVLSGASPTNFTLYVFATPPLPPGVTPQHSDFRLINAFTYSQLGLTTALLAAYNARFDTPGLTAAQLIWFRVACFNWDEGCLGVGVTVAATLTDAP
jgi:hypothetical protein